MNNETLIKKYKEHDQDTGSVGVQIILLTRQMADLVDHLKDHRKDHDSRRGLLKIVNKRRKLLTYLAKTEPKKYQSIIVDLKLRK
ncbi:MAG TPA: 30S ribosomal protein S15 [Patescibacteria group bacterium]|nr:30S ribosomal protein S15 [Patescibacteria group bacterium]